VNRKHKPDTSLVRLYLCVPESSVTVISFKWIINVRKLWWCLRR